MPVYGLLLLKGGELGIDRWVLFPKLKLSKLRDFFWPLVNCGYAQWRIPQMTNGVHGPVQGDEGFGLHTVNLTPYCNTSVNILRAATGSIWT